MWKHMPTIKLSSKYSIFLGKLFSPIFSLLSASPYISDRGVPRPPHQPVTFSSHIWPNCVLTLPKTALIPVCCDYWPFIPWFCIFLLPVCRINHEHKRRLHLDFRFSKHIHTLYPIVTPVTQNMWRQATTHFTDEQTETWRNKKPQVYLPTEQRSPCSWFGVLAITHQPNLRSMVPFHRGP